MNKYTFYESNGQLAVDEAGAGTFFVAWENVAILAYAPSASNECSSPVWAKVEVQMSTESSLERRIREDGEIAAQQQQRQQELVAYIASGIDLVVGVVCGPVCDGVKSALGIVEPIHPHSKTTISRTVRVTGMSDKFAAVVSIWIEMAGKGPVLDDPRKLHYSLSAKMRCTSNHQHKEFTLRPDSGDADHPLFSEKMIDKAVSDAFAQIFKLRS